MLKIYNKGIKPNNTELNLSIREWITDFECVKSLFSLKRIVACSGGGNINDTHFMNAASKLIKQLADEEISVLTGSGSGIMETANIGAFAINKNCSYGLNVKVFQNANSVIPSKNLYNFNTLLVRLLALISVSDAIVFFHGGFGTLNELFSVFELIVEKMMRQVPVYFYNAEFWQDLVE